MFYLETKDGERFLTNPNSDDKVEFEKIVEAKMGAESVDMMNQLIMDAHEEGVLEGESENEYNEDADKIDRYDLYTIQDALHELITEFESQIKNASNVDVSDLIVYAAELTEIMDRLNQL